MNLLLTGRTVDVEEAYAMGLVNVIAEDGKVMDEARVLAGQIINNSPVGVRCTMQLLNRSSSYSAIDEAVTAHYESIDELLSSDDFIEGPRAFSEKRKPQWRNR